MSRLYMFYVGGHIANANIELHDVRFSIGENPSACYDDLRAQWWGTPSSLHIDSWCEISQVDGYDISLSDVPFPGEEKLYFLNLGGYAAEEFEEAHKNILVVATSQRLAIQNSVQAQAAWKQPHKDTLVEVERAILVSEQFEERKIFLHLNKAELVRPFTFEAKYIKLKPAAKKR